MVLKMRRLARTRYGGSIRQLFLCNLGLFSLLNADDLATLSFDANPTLSIVLFSLLVSERTTVGLPLSSMTVIVAPARVQSNIKNW